MEGEGHGLGGRVVSRRAGKEPAEGVSVGDLEAREGVEQLTFYRELLLHLGTKG